MRVAPRVGAIVVAALLLLAAAPAAEAEDAPTPIVYLLSWPTELTNDPDAVFTFTSNATGLPPYSVTCQLDGAASFDCSTGYVSLNGLAEGNHSFVISPADSRGPGESFTFPWTIDLTAPDTSASATPWTNYFGPGVTISSSDTDVSYFECAVGSGPFSLCSFRYPEGLVALRVRAVDRAGNADPTPAEVTFSVDNTPPETTATITQTGPNELSVVIGASDADAGVATVACIIDFKGWDGVAQSQTGWDIDSDIPLCITMSPFLFDTTGKDAELVVWAQATDAAGNVDPTPATVTWVVDRTPPVVSIDSGPAALTTSSGALFVLSATDAHHNLQGSGIDHYICVLSGFGPASCSANTNYYGLADGDYELTVTAVDKQGLTSEPKYWNWTVDTTPPVTSITTGPPTWDANTSGGIGWTVTGGPATSGCSLDGGAGASCSSPFVYTGLSDGEHSLVVRSTDVAGNTEPVGATFTWTVDTIPPTVSIIGKPDALTNDPDANFVIEVAGALAIKCYLDSEPVSCSPDERYTVADGDHTFSAVAFDGAGNESTATHTWTVDTVAPSVSIVSEPDAVTPDPVALFGFAVTGATDLECTLDGIVAACSLTESFTVADGAHTLSVVAIDDAGNRSAAAARTWTVDTIAPTVAITSAPDALTTDPVASFVFDPTGATVLECTLDGALEPCALSDSFTVGDGSHLLSVVAMDDAGNRSDAVEHAWEVDTVEPNTVFSVKPGAVSGATVTFEFETESPAPAFAAYAVVAVDVVFECSLDGDDFESCESPVTVSGLGDGLHSFAVRATDAAGNVESTPAVHTWVVSAPIAAVVPAKVLGATGSAPLPVAVASFGLLLVGAVLLLTRRRRAQ